MSAPVDVDVQVIDVESLAAPTADYVPDPGVSRGAARLDELADVDGATAGLAGQTLVKAGDGQWRPAAPPAASIFTHTQVTPAASWSGTHGLGRYPQAILLDPAGRRFLADLEFPTVNTYSVTHAEPTAGALHLQ